MTIIITTLYIDPHGDHDYPGVLQLPQPSSPPQQHPHIICRSSWWSWRPRCTTPRAAVKASRCWGSKQRYSPLSRKELHHIIQKEKKHLVKANIQPVLKKYSNCNNVERKEQPFLDRGIILWYRPTFPVAATVSCSTATLELYLMGQLSTPEMEYSDEKVSLILLCVLVCCLAKDQLKKDNSKSCKKWNNLISPSNGMFGPQRT